MTGRGAVEGGLPAAPDEADETGASMAALVHLAGRVQERCLRDGLTLVTAESSTGGLVAHALTEVPGSSGYFLGGIVSYSNAAKCGLLGVSEDALRRHGAVSAQVAAAMAAGARARLDADLAIAVTGIAGPDGGSEAKPVGLTYVAVADRAGCDVRRHMWQGERSANKLASAVSALRLLEERLEEGTAR